MAAPTATTSVAALSPASNTTMSNAEKDRLLRQFQTAVEDGDPEGITSGWRHFKEFKAANAANRFAKKLLFPHLSPALIESTIVRAAWTRAPSLRLATGALDEPVQRALESNQRNDDGASIAILRPDDNGKPPGILKDGEIDVASPAFTCYRIVMDNGSHSYVCYTPSPATYREECKKGPYPKSSFAHPIEFLFARYLTHKGSSEEAFSYLQALIRVLRSAETREEGKYMMHLLMQNLKLACGYPIASYHNPSISNRVLFAEMAPERIANIVCSIEPHTAARISLPVRKVETDNNNVRGVGPLLVNAFLHGNYKVHGPIMRWTVLRRLTKECALSCLFLKVRLVMLRLTSEYDSVRDIVAELQWFFGFIPRDDINRILIVQDPVELFPSYRGPYPPGIPARFGLLHECVLRYSFNPRYKVQPILRCLMDLGLDPHTVDSNGRTAAEALRRVKCEDVMPHYLYASFPFLFLLHKSTNMMIHDDEQETGEEQVRAEEVPRGGGRPFQEAGRPKHRDSGRVRCQDREPLRADAGVCHGGAPSPWRQIPHAWPGSRADLHDHVRECAEAHAAPFPLLSFAWALSLFFLFRGRCDE